MPKDRIRSVLDGSSKSPLTRALEVIEREKREIEKEDYERQGQVSDGLSRERIKEMNELITYYSSSIKAKS